MIDPNHPDPYVDEVQHNLGEPAPSLSRKRRRLIGRTAKSRLKNSPTAELRRFTMKIIKPHSLLLALCLGASAPLVMAATDMNDQRAPGTHDSDQMNGNGGATGAGTPADGMGSGSGGTDSNDTDSTGGDGTTNGSGSSGSGAGTGSGPGSGTGGSGSGAGGSGG